MTKKPKVQKTSNLLLLVRRNHQLIYFIMFSPVHYNWMADVRMEAFFWLQCLKNVIIFLIVLNFKKIVEIDWTKLPHAVGNSWTITPHESTYKLKHNLQCQLQILSNPNEDQQWNRLHQNCIVHSHLSLGLTPNNQERKQKFLMNIEIEDVLKLEW